MEKLSFGLWSVPSSSCDLGHRNLPLFHSSGLSILLYQQSHYFEKTFLVETKLIMINTGPLRSKYALIERGGLSPTKQGGPPNCAGVGLALRGSPPHAWGSVGHTEALAGES